ncbi:MAG: helical backbone metal receptor [Syntrophobacteraceae bacterium]
MTHALNLVSLAPTQTEIIAALGMTGRLTGVTDNCDYPPEVRTIPRFGSWYSPDIQAVIEAEPDLVFTFGSHQEEIATALKEAGLGVYHSEPPTIAAAMASMGEIAALIGREEEWAVLAASLNSRLDRIREKVTGRIRRPSVLRIMTWSPLVTPGPGAFQHDVIEFSGGRNVAGDGPAAYFVCNRAEIAARDPEVIFFCGQEIGTMLVNDSEWKNVSAVRFNRIHIHDCGLTCRSGPRIVEMAERLNQSLMSIRCRSAGGEPLHLTQG